MKRVCLLSVLLLSACGQTESDDAQAAEDELTTSRPCVQLAVTLGDGFQIDGNDRHC